MTRRRLTAVLFVSLLLFWFALSGRFDPLFVAMGVASAALVTWVTRDVVATALGEASPRGRLPYRAWRAVVYVVWLLGRIFVASAQVAYFVLHPRVPLEPAVLRFRTTLRHPVARTILANSITLVPGTMTLRLVEGEYVVHALVPAAADDLVSGRMQTMIGAVFLEGPEPAPEVAWEPGVGPG
jgi:multicomponent Na+:H+ antiporter subunit E